MGTHRLAWFLLFPALLLAGCASTAPVPAGPDVLRVGVTPNLPPMVFEEGGTLTGLEVDFARALAADLDRQPVFRTYDWEDLIPALQKDEIDVIMSGMSVTASRASIVDFSDPYLRVGQIAIIRRKDAREYPFSQAILFTKGKIGVEKGTTGDLLVQDRCRNAERVEFSSPEKGVEALARGKIDAFVHDAPVAWRLAAEHEAEGVVAIGPALTEEVLAWAFLKGDDALREQANLALAEWGRNGRLGRFIGRWLPMAEQ